ncbi:MAG: methyltransferase domain-containing protein [Bacteroidetes bacterium]|nr:methyltransferase domain-containing protein [Bacteroidota bacterium]
MMKAIVADTLKQKELTELGYTQFPLLDLTGIEKLKNYYRAYQAEDPQHFYSSTHSPNFDFRKNTSDFIKQVIEPYIAKHLDNYKLLGGAFVVKPAHGKGILQAHQDWNLVDESLDRSYNLWIPLIDVSEANGAIYVLDKSHNKIQTYRGPHISSVFKNIEQQLWPYLKILPMKEGEALFYDHALLHGSPPNNSSEHRIGVVIGVVKQDTDLLLYANDNGEIKSYDCDENFFLKKNTSTDFIQLPQREIVSTRQNLLTLAEFETIFIETSANPIHNTPMNTDKRSFFEMYTPKNIIAEAKYRLRKKDTIHPKKIETEKTTAAEKKDVAKFYNEQTDNFLKVYGDVIQAFRTKNISTLLDYQINAIGLNSGIKALDAGCGVCGPAVYFAQNTKCQIEAMTISKKQAELAKQKIAENHLSNLINITEGDYHQLENYYSQHTFDVVYFLESFGHALNHKQVLHSAWNVLKPGGSIYIKDLFIKKTPFESMEAGIDKEVKNINEAYHYNIPDLNTILDIARKKGYIISLLKTIDIPLEEFENLTISNDFQDLTGINKIDNLRNYIFPVDFFELKLIKRSIDLTSGNSSYFLQNMYLMQIENWKESDL